MATAEDTDLGHWRAEERLDEQSVLILADHQNTEKIERHYGPLADAVGETTMVCIDGNEAVDAISFIEVPALGHRLLAIPLLALVGLLECLWGDYDAIVSISLVPYGTFTLLVGTLTDTPTHLGIIGGDIDRHVPAWYGAIPRALIRRFDAVSVPGTFHVERVVDVGVPRERIFVLTNTIDAATFQPPSDPVERDIDFLWIGRFSAEKAPGRFVRAVAELAAREVPVTAVMVGDGDRLAETRQLADRMGVADIVTFTGWVDEPLEYYHRSRAFVLTSRREGLPLTMLETMASGVVPVVPPVGSVTDVAVHEGNALVVDRPDPVLLADAMERLQRENDLLEALAAKATEVRETHTYDVAQADWQEIMLHLLGADEH